MADPKLLAEWFWTDRWMGSSGFLLAMEPRGLYREMLTQAWRRGARLPVDHEEIRRAVGCTLSEWKRCWPKIERFWRVDGDALVNDTQLEVYAEAVLIQERNMSRARAGATARWKQSPSNAQALPEDSPSTAQALRKQCTPSPSPSPSQISVGNTPTRIAPLVASHRSHAMCGIVCVPRDAWDGMLRRLGGDEDKLRAWVGSVLEDWQRRVDAGEIVSEGDDFAFWRARWTERFGQAKGSSQGDRHVESADDTAKILAERRKWVS